MDAKFKFSLRGTEFGIETHLINTKNTGWEFEKSILSRFFIKQDRLCDYSNIQKILKLFNLRLPYKTQVIFIDNEKLTLVTEDHLTQSDYHFDNIDLDYDLGNNRLGSLVCANNFIEAGINLKVFQSIIQELLPTINTFSGVTVFSGELVWSGWIDYFIMLCTLLNNEMNTGNYALDSYGIWEYALTNIEEEKSIKNFSKSLFYPNITLINNINNKIIPFDKLRIQKEKAIKYIHNTFSPFNYYDLLEEGYELVDSQYHLARHLLIKNKARIKLRQNKKEGLFTSSLKTNPIYTYSHEINDRNRVGIIALLYNNLVIPSIDFRKLRNVKDIIIKGSKKSSIFIEVPVGSVIALIEGQIIVKGDVLYSYKKNGKSIIYASEVDGKVSKSLLERGILEIVIDEKIVTIPNNIPGRIKNIIKPNLINLETELIELPVTNNNQKELTIGGEIHEWSESIIEAITNSCYKTILYIRSKTTIDFTNIIFKTGIISAILIARKNLLDEKSKRQLDSINIPIVFLDRNSQNANPEIERILSICIGKYVQISSNKLLIPNVYIAQYSKILKQFEHNKILKKGVIVKFQNYQSDYLYGKIEKSSDDSSQKHLLNMPDGIYEAHPANIFII